MQVAIIGAGVAGLAAAHVLMHHGVSTTIYEKSRGVGGRIATRRAAGCFFDHGTQVIKAPTEDMQRLVDACRDSDGSPAYDIGRPVALFDAAGIISEGDSELNAEPQWGWKSGVNVLAKHLARGLDIRLDQTIAAIHPATIVGGPRYTLFDSPRNVIGHADAIIFTPPAPQTAAIIEASGIDADLKATLQVALATGTYRRSISCTFAFAQPFDPPWYALLNSDRRHPIAWLACEHAKPGHAPAGTSLLTAQMSDEFSIARWDEVQRGEIGSTALPAFAKDILAHITNLIACDLGEPKWGYAHRWRYALPIAPADAETLARIGSPQHLFFAGDYLTTLGRVHLAIESGELAARQCLDL